MDTENSTFSSAYPLSSIFDLAGDAASLERTSLGFVELLAAHQDLRDPSVFDFPEPASATTAAPPVPESSDITNLPATPNSSSISSGSTEAHTAERPKGDEDQDRTKKTLKPKKNNQKRAREPRFAFMTKSEVDHLEDGYRWRKYGQKAVKNSPFPRSYYRCTTAMCGVKKRVERSCEDPNIVVTTYEGQHTHPSPASSNRIGPTVGISADSLGFATPTMQMSESRLLHQQQSHFFNMAPPVTFTCSSSMPASSFATEMRFCTSTAALLRDHGLLQDILPGLQTGTRQEK